MQSNDWVWWNFNEALWGIERRKQEYNQVQTNGRLFITTTQYTGTQHIMRSGVCITNTAKTYWKYRKMRETYISVPALFILLKLPFNICWRLFFFSFCCSSWNLPSGLSQTINRGLTDESVVGNFSLSPFLSHFLPPRLCVHLSLAPLLSLSRARSATLHLRPRGRYTAFN